MFKTIEAATPRSHMRGARKSLSHYRAGTALALCMVCAMSLASKPAIAGGTLPTNGQYVAGQGTISGNGNSLTINQTSNRGIINWQGFSIGNGNTVQFDNGSGATLNRVTGGNLSQIDGSLKATGSIYLINPQGIVIGPSGTVITNGSFVASTRDVASSAFMSGSAFAASGSSNGGVINQGVITSNTGDAILVGQSVTNSGTISAPNGTVGLAAGNEILLQPVGSDARIAISGGTGSVTNSGTLRAAQVELNSAGGNVYALVENNGGAISATGTKTVGGHVWLTAGGTTTVTGSVSATNANGTGGAVSINGANVALQGAGVHASGTAGGGTITIGNASTQSVTADSATSLDASALSTGSGGSLTVKSQNTTFAGMASARGGALSGDGGNVETSGVVLNIAGARVDTTAAHGTTGNWTLDPTNIDIVDGGGDPIGGSNIDPGTIAAALATSNVTLDATNQITVLSELDYTSSNTLSLLAEGSIVAEAGIQNMGSGAINVIAGWNGTTFPPSPLTAPGVYGNNDGDIFIDAGNLGSVAVGSEGGTTTLAAANISVDAAGGYAQVGFHGAGGGAVVVDATQSINVAAESFDAQIGNGGTGVSDNVGGAITVNAPSVSLTETPDRGAEPFFAAIGNVSDDAVSSQSGAINVAASNSLTVAANGLLGLAYVGNFSIASTAGGATGDITVNAGAVNLQAQNAGQAIIGDGGRFTNNGTTGGTIAVTAGTISLAAIEGPDATGQARIANRGDGIVTSDIDISTSSDLDLNAADNGLASIGNGQGATGTTSGNINVNVGGNIFLTATGFGNARIAGGVDAGTNITVVAAGQIDLSTAADPDGTTTGGLVFIGNFQNETAPETGNVFVQSTGAGISLTANEDQSTVQIGNSSATPTGGTVAVTAAGLVAVVANGNTAIAQIGNTADQGDAMGNISVNAGDVSVITNGQRAFAVIGNLTSGATSSTSGDISVTAGVLSVDALALGSLAYVGNLSSVETSGGATGDITINASSVSLNAADAGEEAIIGDGGKFTNGGTTGGTITVNAGSLSLTAPTNTIDGAAGQARIANRGTGDVSGDIDITTTGNVDLESGDFGLAGIGNGQGGTGITTGNITMNVGGALTLSASGSGNARIGTGDGADSTINITAAGDILLETAVDADGTTSGAQSFIGNFQAIGGQAGGNLSVTSTGGTISLLANENGSTVEIGSPSGTPAASAITVSSFGTIDVAANGMGSVAEIGNNDGGSAGDVSGNISVTGGSDINVLASNQSAVAAIGNITSDGVSSASGEIAVTTGGTLNVQASVPASLAYVGNLSTVLSTGGATGDITVNANTVALTALDGGAQAIIGDGGRFTNSGLVGGTITINAGSLSLYTPTNAADDAAGQARIANRGDGIVQGDIDIATTADIDITAGDNGLAGIGNGQGATGTTSGNINVQAGGNIFLAATGAGEARIAAGLDTGTNISVIAAGQIDLSTAADPDGTTTGALALIGNFQNEAAPETGNVTVQSTGAGISLTANEDQSTAQIGNQSSLPTGGTVSVTALGLVDVVANGNTAVAQIGNNADQGDATGNIAVIAGEISIITNGQSAIAAIGNLTSGATSAESGDIAIATSTLNIDAQALGSLAYVGNLSSVETSSGATGNISINAGSITLYAGDAGEEAIIGDGGKFTNDGSTGGNITITTGSLTLTAPTASDDDAAGQARIANRGDGAVDGDINITTTGDIVLSAGDGGLVEIGNGQAATGITTGNIMIAAGGDLTLTASGIGNARIATNFGSDSNIDVTAAGNITIDTVSDPDGTTAGGQSFIGSFDNDLGGAVGGNVSVTSTGGTIVVEANEDQSIAEIGNMTASPSGGTITLTATSGTIALTAAGVGAIAQIGNNADLADATGNVSVTAGTDVDITASGQSSFATIGNMGSGPTSSESGDIAVTAGGALNVQAQSLGGLAYVGNLSSVASTGGATGNITVNAGSISLDALDGSEEAIIGDGGKFTNSGLTGGTITINTGSLSLYAPTNIADQAAGQARIINRGDGVVQGDIDITTTGDIDLTAGDGGLAGIGNSQNGTGPTSGNIAVAAGGNIFITASGAGEARMATGIGAVSIINVTAAGQIDLATNADPDGTTTGAAAFIGSFQNEAGAESGNVTVLSFNAGISLTANEDQSLVEIGNSSGTPSGGNVRVGSAGLIDVVANGMGATAQIGNNADLGDATGNVSVSAGEISVITNGQSAFAVIGNLTSGATSSASGDIAINGGSLDVDAQAFGSLAYVGNLSSVATSGGATGDISVVVGAIGLLASGGGDEAIIGDGGKFTNAGPTGGTIDISANTLTLSAPSNQTASAQARIANRGIGEVSGDIDIATTGGIDLEAGDDSLTAIGNGQAGTGPTTGYITIQSGSFITLTATGTGNARISTGDSSDSAIDVTAAGDIALSTAADSDGTTTGGSVFIGNLELFTGSPVGGNVFVISTGGSIALAAGEDQSFVQIGNQTGAPSSGTVTVAANAGNISLSAAGVGALTQIGNGGTGMPGDATGDIFVSAGGDLTLGASGTGAVAQIGNGDASGTGIGNASGDMTITIAGETSLQPGGWIGNLAEPGFIESGNVTLVTGTQDAANPVVLAPSLVADLGSTAVLGSGGNVAVGFTNEDMPINTAVSYDSPNTLSLLSTRNIVVDASLQNAGSGAINLVAGWDGRTLPPAPLTAPGVYGGLNGSITVGGGTASGGVSVGSASGTTTLAAANVTVEADNGFAQVGYRGAADGDLVVDAVGTVAVTAQDFDAQIGNGGTTVSGNTGGDITVNAGGFVIVQNLESLANPNILVAAIGNISGDATSSQSGDIAITAGNSVLVEGLNGFGLTFIGNLSAATTSGGATGNITIDTGTLDVLATANTFETIVGDGGLDVNSGGFANGGPTGGNITINAGSVTVQAMSGGGDQARIASRGFGTVTGNIAITTTGDVDILAGDVALADIGDGGIGTTSGDITINAGGNVNLTATGTGNARIAGTFAADTDISVTAAGNITLSTGPDSDGTTTGGSIFIGNFAISEEPVGGNITLTSTGGNVSLNAAENQSFIAIGQTAFTAATGNVTVSANNIALSAGGAGALAQIGNGGTGMAGDATGNVTLVASGNLSLSAAGSGAFAQIGNGDAFETGIGNASGDIAITVAGTTTITASPTSGTSWIGNLAEPGFVESGNVSLTTGTVTNTDVFGGSDTLGAMTVADLGSTSVAGSGGNVSLDFTNPKKHTLSTQLGTSQLLYNSPNTLSITIAGALTDDVSLLNSGAGTVALATTGSGAIALDAAIEGGTVALNSAKGISGNGAGYITAGTLEGSADGAVTLTAANVVADLGPFTNVSGAFTFTDIVPLTVTGAVTTPGALTLTTTGSGNGITLDAGLSGGTVDLVSTGGITQSASGTILATTLEGSAVNDVVLNAANSSTNLGGFTVASGNFAYTNAAPLKVTGAVTVNTSTGIIDLTTTGAGSNLTINGALTAATVNLNSSGTITDKTTGIITAGTLEGSSDGAATLTAANAVASVGPFTTSNGDFAFTDTDILVTTSAINAGTGDLTLTASGAGSRISLDAPISGATIDLISGSVIGQLPAGVITAATLKGSAVGGVILGDGNEIANLGPFSSGGVFLLEDASALTVTGAVTASGQLVLNTGGGLEINSAVTGGNVIFNASGEIGSNGAGVITASTLTGSSSGAVQLTAKNQVTTLDGFTTNNGLFTFSDNGPLTIAGPLNTGTGDISLTTTGAGNDMTFTGTVDTSGTLTLVTSGAANETNTGAIIANTLNVTAQTGISLTSSLNMINHVGKDKTKSGPNNITL